MIYFLVAFGISIANLNIQNRDKFNLHCEGKKISVRDSSTFEPWSADYRFDLTKMSWCGRDCSSVFELSGLTEQEISISNDMKIDRITGKLVALTPMSAIGVARIEAQCKRLDFTGFPEKMF